uniref:Uncharacterized protein AlNc14C37G3262 n=1 Tax=Albugo laibachii Nc14 TaxID=890382 RepID=F0W8Y7_9STRA|nr:conserved hypothetical protein [Albugo laibachii Nc14]|eukprot:CCA17598.1 conserved hypothetical protein [Albugo laibachii Nc14]
MERTELFQSQLATFAPSTANAEAVSASRTVKEVSTDSKYAAISTSIQNVQWFNARAVEIKWQISDMENILRQSIRSYVDPRYHLSAFASDDLMTEEERDAMDEEIMEMVRLCVESIDKLKDCIASASSKSAEEHQHQIVTYLLQRLQSITNVTKMMQKSRSVHSILTSGRLLPHADQIRVASMDIKIEKHASPRLSISKIASPNRSVAPKSQPAHMSSDLQLQQENESLHQHFEESLEDARKMETKMTEISHLMSQFSSKIMDQQADITLIHQHAQSTQLNLQQSTKILHRAYELGNGYGFAVFCVYAGASVLLWTLHHLYD